MEHPTVPLCSGANVGAEDVAPYDSVEATVDYVRTLLADRDVAGKPLLLARAGELLTAAAGATTPSAAVVEGGDGGDLVATAAVRRAVSFIEANAENEIGLDEISRVARIGPRALQSSFRRCYDQTPMGYVRAVRLARAHDELRGGDPADGVTVHVVAARWGFTHPGRFSLLYRRTYGQAPSLTLRT